ncbi:MAG: HAD-IB family phosphatase [Candidatus Heimdallarchaeota archaeon]|nr:MAG: HAD-IB family phosphatase [Candidatus Heimdallarchaeota archaeon]
MSIKIIVFDMDGVLVNIRSSWLFVHEKLGVNSVKNFYKYQNKEIDYQEFMRRDITLWGPRTIDEIRNILKTVPLMEGIEDTLPELKRRGYLLAILTAGISLLAERLHEQFSFHYVYANRLCESQGVLTGKGEVVVELMSKGSFLELFLLSKGIERKNCIVIGDSQFDVPMFSVAGFSIAFNTSDELVRKAADVSVESQDLRELLPLIP